MARVFYEATKFRPATLAVIAQANVICEEYAVAGIPLTLRQLYYQFVARALVPENTQQQYNRLGAICRNARMAGVMDWDHLVDMTRDLRSVSSWEDPAGMLTSAAESYHRDLWRPQRKRVEVWVEKDAAIGVVQGVCGANSVPYFSCRGFTSMSEMHVAAQRIRGWVEAGDQVHILHIGDHDPSGWDMTRDIEARLDTFITRDWLNAYPEQFPGDTVYRSEVTNAMREHLHERGTEIEDDEQPWSLNRIALNMDQIRAYRPPPNYAKETDSRYERYVEETGQVESWELDALDPAVMVGLIQTNIDGLRDVTLWNETVQEMEEERAELDGIRENYEAVRTFLATLSGS